MGRVTRKQGWIAAAAVTVVVVVAGLVWFKPWALWVNETVHEALPSAPAPTAAPGAPSASSDVPSPSVPAEPTGPVTVAQGRFITHEHATTGVVKIVRLADGSHTLRLEDLDTSNGPDLRVWLSDAPVKEGKAGWGVFDDGKYLNLAKLKGNRGDQNYPLPADVDWSAYTSVSIWCDRFDVSFGAAEIARV
ncbi:DM13 domain-containing protein [Streptomyces sp. NPDC058872]|uniref:DM13 domain-containing protein n=1 Tax=Streptomyces sp. NPDC058872 TaxID=3346661 RepID=UPI0036968E7A